MVHAKKGIELQYKEIRGVDTALTPISILSPKTKCINGYYDFTRNSEGKTLMHGYDRSNFDIGHNSCPSGVATYDEDGNLECGNPARAVQEENQKAGINCFKTCKDYFKKKKNRKHYKHYTLRKGNKNYLLKTNDKDINNKACLKKKKNLLQKIF